MIDPFQKFLGLSATADAFRLLALTPGQRHPRAVLQALQSQLARVDRHPDRGDPDANAVRQYLHAAAQALLATEPAVVAPTPPTQQPVPPPSPQPTPPDPRVAPQPQRPVLDPRPPATAHAPPLFNAAPHRLALTAFDRHVMAVLVACGGWNADSRARLVQVAGEHGISPQGLMKVVAGLGDFARQGTARVDVAHITQGARRFEQLPPAPQPAAHAAAQAELSEALLPELKEGSAWATIKLSLLFGAVTIMAGLMFLNVLIRPDDEPARPPTPPTAQNNDANDAIAAPRQTRETTPPDSSPPPQDLLAEWTTLPGFRGDRSPDAAADALDQSPRLPELLDELARKLAVAEAPSAASRQDWRLFVEQAALTWVQGDRAVVRAIKANLFDVLFAVADRASVAEEFIDVIAEGAQRLDDPLDLWRGPWSAGILSEIAARADLPAYPRQLAAAHISEILAEEATQDRNFNSAAGHWLALQVPRLVELTEISPQVYEFWELWLEAEQALGASADGDQATVEAIAGILRSPIDLAREGPSLNVLGRLIHEANFETSTVVRDGVLPLLNDPAIETRDLWVFTSLLVQAAEAPWMNESFVIAADAAPEARRDAMIRMEKAWPREQRPETPVLAGRGITVDRALGERWMSLARQQVAALSSLSQPRADTPRTLMERMVLAAWLNEAAQALAHGATQEAEQVIRLVEIGWRSTAPPSRGQQQAPSQPAFPRGPSTPPPQTPGGPVPGNPGMPTTPGGAPMLPNQTTPGSIQPGQWSGQDGFWTAAYDAAQRNIDERMELLRSLRTTTGGDLGPIDSRRLVDEAYRAPVPELRLFAQTILNELFTRGPNIALQLIDQFTDAPANDITAAFLTDYLGGRSLPEPESSQWHRAARLALLEHALRLMPFADMEIDELAEALAESFGDRLRLLRPEQSGGSASWSDPAESAEALVTEWRAQAARRMVADPVPDPLAVIERRHETRRALAQGPIERTVAAQITLLELHIYVAVAEQPVLAGEARSLLERTAQERAEADHILEQALLTELAAVQVWMLRIEIAGEASAGAEEVTQ